MLSLGSIVEYNAAAFFPGGKRLMIAAHEQGRPTRLFVQDLAAGEPRAVSAEDVRFPMGSSPVAPDGAHAFALGPSGLALYPLGGGEPRPIPKIATDEVPLRWNENGAAIYVLGPSPDGRHVDRVEMANGARRRLWELRPGGMGVIPDMAFVTADGAGYVFNYGTAGTLLFEATGLSHR